MDLWDREIPPLEEAVAHLASSEQFRLAVDAVDWTVSTAPVQIQDSEASGCIENIMREARDAVARNQDSVELSDDVLGLIDAAEDSVSEPGVFQILQGVHRFFSSGLVGAPAIEDILYDCFEFSAQREEGPTETLEEQQANPRLREVVEHQRNLILNAGQSSL